MGAQENNDYYNILLEGFKQAFESKENYSFVKELNDLKGSITPKIYSNLLQKIVTVPQQSYLKEKDIFFKYLEKIQVDFEEKYLVKKRDFYSKCLNSLIVKLEVEKKESTGKGITRTSRYVNLPNDLKFLVSMKIHIKYKSLQFNDTTKPQQNEVDKRETLSLKENESFSFANNFDHIQKERVYNYFKAELVDKNYLSLHDLQRYLITAFQEKTLPEEKFKLKGDYNKGIVTNIFYRYYNEIAQDKHGLKRKYCQLLGEYFNGFETKKVIGNFNK